MTPSRTHLVRHGGVDLDVDLYPGPRSGGPALLVLPGGGFREHTAHDGTGYARWLHRMGFGAVVLRYRLRPDPFPQALQQARAALDALQRGLLLPDADPARIGVIGSSAGGLLAGLLATGAVLSIEPSPAQVPRPWRHIQCYGLADLNLLPPAAVEALLGPLASLAQELSPITHIDALTPSSFVWATAQDGPGLPNALTWTQALADHEVPVELHIYPNGPHGVGLADGHYRTTAIPHTARWTHACETWLTDLDVDAA